MWWPVARPPRSPDINPLDSILWGYMKSVYKTKMNSVEERRQGIEVAAAVYRNGRGSFEYLLYWWNQRYPKKKKILCIVVWKNMSSNRSLAFYLILSVITLYSGINKWVPNTAYFYSRKISHRRSWRSSQITPNLNWLPFRTWSIFQLSGIRAVQSFGSNFNPIR